MGSPVHQNDQRTPLLLEEDTDYVAYDDDDLEAAARLRAKKKRVKTCFWFICAVSVIVLIGVCVFLLSNWMNSRSDNRHSRPSLGKYKHAAVASDVSLCSTIGRDIMENKRGNAVDAALASLLCMGLADPQSMGLGGGFFMTIYNRTSGKSYTIDARETAPAAATTDMFYNGSSSTKGGLAIAVPGEIRGYDLAWRQYGTPGLWEEIFRPAIDMAENGFIVPGSLARALQDVEEDNPELLEDQQFRKKYINPKTGELYKEGEVIQYTTLSKTLKILSKSGAEEFYTGSLSDDVLDDIKEHNSSSIITKDDLKNYVAKQDQSLNVTLRNGYTIYSPVPPSSGVILSFILKILDGFNMTGEDLKTTEGKILTYHRIVEAFKFAYAKRTDLGDPFKTSEPIQGLVRNLTSQDYIDAIRAMIWDNQTHPLDYYGPTFYHPNKTSTAQLSVVDQHGTAVSVTSTINTRFGSGVIGSRTGIIFNNEMDDFATSNLPNNFGIYPSPANFIKPGRRPLSSMCPAILVDRKGDVRLVVGGAGGSRITTAVAFVAAHVLWLDQNIEESIDALRLHHQLLPPEVSYETGFNMDVINGLKAKGHNVTVVATGKSIIQGITRQSDGMLFANSDYRKGGKPDGF